jgi:predicted Holliday junction resolvase-like endonuclease
MDVNVDGPVREHRVVTEEYLSKKKMNDLENKEGGEIRSRLQRTSRDFILGQFTGHIIPIMICHNVRFFNGLLDTIYRSLQNNLREPEKS